MTPETGVGAPAAGPRARAEELRVTLLATLRPLLEGVRDYALVYFPHSPNVGDSAIYLGQLACLRELGLPSPRFVCDLQTYDRAALERAVGNGPILFSGGGSFGDLWPLGQACREEVLRSFRGNRIVQLPQSLHFGSATALQAARDAVEGHPDFTLLVRDRRSLEFAKKQFRAMITLCPDMVFGLGPLGRAGPPRQAVLWLLRRDHESADSRLGAGLDALECPDWCEERETLLCALSYRLIGAVRRRGIGPLFRPALMALYPRLASQRLRRGLRLLSSADVVVTDRLHGHLLALLLGIPHVVLDDRNGKVSGFRETWTSDVNGVRAASSREEAALLAHELHSRSTDPAWA